MSEISCTNCAACCKEGTAMALTDVEVNFMVEGGTELIELLPAMPEKDWSQDVAGVRALYEQDPRLAERVPAAATSLKGGEGYYYMAKNCGYLTVAGACSAHEDPLRPRICQVFQTGSAPCRTIRIRRGIDEASPIVTIAMPKLNAMDFAETDTTYSAFVEEEIKQVQQQNPWLLEITADVIDSITAAQGQKQGRMFVAGLLYAHRMLRASNNNQSLPERSLMDLQSLFLACSFDAQARNHKRRSGSLLEPVFRQVFASNERLLTHMYDELILPFSRYGMETLLLLYGDQIDPETLTVFGEPQ